MKFCNVYALIHVSEVKESITDISTEQPCLGDIENPGRFPVQHVLGGIDGCLLVEPPALALVFIHQAKLNVIYTAKLSY